MSNVEFVCSSIQRKKTKEQQGASLTQLHSQFLWQKSKKVADYYSRVTEARCDFEIPLLFLSFPVVQILCDGALLHFGALSSPPHHGDQSDKRVCHHRKLLLISAVLNKQQQLPSGEKHSMFFPLKLNIYPLQHYKGDAFERLKVTFLSLTS